MNKYQITVIYAAHNKDHVTAFPAQTIPASKIQVIPVCENDNFHPRKQALNAINRALGTYTILLDEQDRSPNSSLHSSFPAWMDPTLPLSFQSNSTSLPFIRAIRHLLSLLFPERRT